MKSGRWLQPQVGRLDLAEQCGTVPADAAGEQWDHQDPGGGEPGLTVHRPLPAVAVQMMLAGVHLQGKPDGRPPAVRYADEAAVVIEDGRVPQRLRKETAGAQQVAQLAFGCGTATPMNILQRPPWQRAPGDSPAASSCFSCGTPASLRCTTSAMSARTAVAPSCHGRCPPPLGPPVSTAARPATTAAAGASYG